MSLIFFSPPFSPAKRHTVSCLRSAKRDPEFIFFSRVLFLSPFNPAIPLFPPLPSVGKRCSPYSSPFLRSGDHRHMPTPPFFFAPSHRSLSWPLCLLLQLLGRVTRDPSAFPPRQRKKFFPPPPVSVGQGIPSFSPSMFPLLNKYSHPPMASPFFPDGNRDLPPFRLSRDGMLFFFATFGGQRISLFFLQRSSGIIFPPPPS